MELDDIELELERRLGTTESEDTEELRFHKEQLLASVPDGDMKSMARQEKDLATSIPRLVAPESARAYTILELQVLCKRELFQDREKDFLEATDTQCSTLPEIKP